MSSDPSNLVFIVSGPSGVGKSTLIRRVMEKDPTLAFSVSHTTRPPRPGEVDGRDYYFVSRDVFSRLISQDAFLEWAEVHGELYGTSKKEIDRLHHQGKNVILDIDVQGAQHVMEKLERNRWVAIFILPPDMDTLEKRLISRGQDTKDRINQRLAVARKEIASARQYDYRVVNDQLERAASELLSIIQQERKKRTRPSE